MKYIFHNVHDVCIDFYNNSFGEKNDVFTSHDQNHVQNNPNATCMSYNYCNQNVNILIQKKIHLSNLKCIKNDIIIK